MFYVKSGNVVDSSLLMRLLCCMLGLELVSTLTPPTNALGATLSISHPRRSNLTRFWRLKQRKSFELVIDFSQF